MRGLVLSGGGAKGCYQVGVLKALIEKEIKFDMVSGVSTGSLQGSMFAQGKFNKLYELWYDIKRSDIFKYKMFGYIGAFLGAKSLYNFSPLLKMLEEHIDVNNWKIPFRCGVVCLEDGKYYTITEKHDQIHKMVYASCSMPFYAEPVLINGRHYVDGGVRNMTPLKEAIDFGCDEIFIVLCSPLDMVAGLNYNRCLKILERSLGIIINEIYNEDLNYGEFINTLVIQGAVKQYRKIKFHIIYPNSEIIDTLNFNQDKIRRGIERGYWDGKRELGRSGYF